LKILFVKNNIDKNIFINKVCFICYKKSPPTPSFRLSAKRGYWMCNLDMYKTRMSPSLDCSILGLERGVGEISYTKQDILLKTNIMKDYTRHIHKHKLKDYSKQNRKNPTLAEKIFREEVLKQNKT
jgi:hypothetical protein